VPVTVRKRAGCISLLARFPMKVEGVFDVSRQIGLLAWIPRAPNYICQIYRFKEIWALVRGFGGEACAKRISGIGLFQIKPRIFLKQTAKA
jgi:hypothetical protein